MKIKSGFTLIELLVTMCIIGIMAGLLLPVVNTVRAKAKTVVCASNLRQIGAAILSYAEENEGLLFPKVVFANGVGIDSKLRAWWGPNGYLDEYLPPRSYAHGGMIGYRENNGVFDCPANSLPCMPTNWAQTRGEGGYGVCSAAAPGQPGVFFDTIPRNLKSLNRNDYAMVGDTNITPLNVTTSIFIARMPYMHHVFSPLLWSTFGPDPVSNERNWVAYRHSGDSNYKAGGGNYVLVDGSVKYITFSSMLDRTINGQFNYYFMVF
jgi:prepilin-type N-terminal cleavage/methylation domain-containing protein